MEITRTFAPAFGKEAAMLDRMLQRRLAQGAPDGLRLRSRLSQERPKRTALPRQPSEKKLRKNFAKRLAVWNKLLTFAPAFEKDTPELRSEKLRKKFRKNLEDMPKTPYLCNRFPLKRKASRKSDLWWDLHKQYSSTRAKLETVSGKRKNRHYLYI